MLLPRLPESPPSKLNKQTLAPDTIWCASLGCQLYSNLGSSSNTTSDTAAELNARVTCVRVACDMSE
jgi:hypothetical protein